MGTKVLVAGGAGYIGSHTVLALLEAGYEPIIADNFSNSKPAAILAVEKLAGQKVHNWQLDLASDQERLRSLFAVERPEAVIQFAGYKAVGESVQKPLEYYRNNLDTTLSLLEVMREFACHKIIFSSSATVYGTSQKMPLQEDDPNWTTSPYGWTKFFNERILMDVCHADPKLAAINLRYFNPVGAHPSGEIGEDPQGIPNNLMPYITQVAVGRREKLTIFGNDYPTPDGTCVRDYIHVVDLAEGHVAALNYMMKGQTGCQAINLGTGYGVSVQELVDAFIRVNQVKLPYVYGARREGDVAVCYADASKAKKLLGWQTRYTLDDMCRDAWNWQSKHPQGFPDTVEAGD